MIKLCVFDLDGTTVNSLNSIAYFANETLKRFGQKTFSVDEYRHLAGGGARKLWRNLVNASGAPEELYETTGFTTNVIFPCSAIVDSKGHVTIYYGVADTNMAIAFTTVEKLLEFVKKYSE